MVAGSWDRKLGEITTTTCRMQRLRGEHKSNKAISPQKTSLVGALASQNLLKAP